MRKKRDARLICLVQRCPGVLSFTRKPTNMPKNPVQATAFMKKGVQAMRVENYGIARGFFEKALKLDKDNPDIHCRLAQLALILWKSEEAIEYARRALKRRANHPDTLLLLSQAYMQMGDMENMHAALDRAITQDPTHEPSIHAKVMAYINSGETELAEQALQRAEVYGETPALLHLARGKVARTKKDYSEAIGHYEQILKQDSAMDRQKRSARYELGHCYDALGEYDTAFEFFRVANGGHLPGKALHAPSQIEQWSKQVLDGIPESGNESMRPVFILGMPRSGTTLTEQILAAHPEVASVGEAPLLGHQYSRKGASNLTGADIESYTDEYLRMLDERVGSTPTRVVDKHIGMERTLGLISKMFPRARVIHCLRDPIDSCLSTYFQNFGSNVIYSRDLKMIGEQYVAHRRVMDYWYENLGIEILQSRYEELVADFEPRARAIVEHTGLEFHEDCLSFHESKNLVSTASSVQVRSPIYQSSKQRWRNYEKHIGDLIDALGEYADTSSVSTESSQGA